MLSRLFKCVLGGVLIIGLTLTALPRFSHAQDTVPQKIESDDARVARSGNWTTQAAASASADHYLYSSGSEADVLSLAFEGASLEILYVAGPSLGTLAIEVDGIVLRTVITTDTETRYGQSAKIDYLTHESHTLKVYAQNGGIIAVDAFVIYTPLPAATVEVVQNAGEVVENENQAARFTNDLTTTVLSDSQIRLTWTDTQPDETNMRVERSPNGTSDWLEIAILPVNSTTQVNISLICNTAYHYRVRAYRASDNTYSAYSNIAAATTSPCPANCHMNAPIVRVSTAADGTQTNYHSEFATLSLDGRYALFESRAAEILPPDYNGQGDIYMRDLLTCQITRISMAYNGTQPNGESIDPMITPDNRYVAYASAASNIVVGDTNGRQDVFVHDRWTGQTTRVSVSSTGIQANDYTTLGDISDDGRYVTFSSLSTSLVPGEYHNMCYIPLPPSYGGPCVDVYIHDRQTAQTSLITVNSGGQQADRGGNEGKMSGDGRYVTFHSMASNLGGPAGNNVYVRDTQLGTTTAIWAGGVTVNYSLYPDISPDGRYVVFVTPGGGLYPNDTNLCEDVFIYDRQTEQTQLLSQGLNGQTAIGCSTGPAISAGGRYISFNSSASNLVANDSNAITDTFVLDRETGQIVRVSVALGSGANGPYGSTGQTSLTHDGRLVAFTSWTGNLVPNDTNNFYDVFVARVNLQPDTLALFNPATNGANLVESLTNPPPAGDYTAYPTNFPHGAGGQYVMGDWDGDGLKTMGVYHLGAFWYTNEAGSSNNWTGIWFGLGGQAVAGRYNPSFNRDCIGVTDSGSWTTGDTYYALYFTCDLTSGPTPTLSFQWLSILLPTSGGFTGTAQFEAGDFNGDGLDTIAMRRGSYIVWTDVPPNTLLTEFRLAQIFGAPGSGGEGDLVVGDWNLDYIDSFGLVYQNGQFYWKNDLEWNSGIAHRFQQVTPLVGTPFIATTWQPN